MNLLAQKKRRTMYKVTSGQLEIKNYNVVNDKHFADTKYIDTHRFL